MKKLNLLAIASLILVSCGGDNQSPTRKLNTTMDPQFDNYKTNFVEELWKTYPGWASSQGYHKYDSILIVPNADARAKELAFAKENLDSLKAFDLISLSQLLTIPNLI